MRKLLIIVLVGVNVYVLPVVNTSVVCLLRLREHTGPLRAVEAEKMRLFAATRAYGNIFNTLYSADVGGFKKMVNMGEFIKQNPESTDSFLMLLKNMPDHIICKIRLFRYLVASDVAKNFYVLQRIIASAGFDVNEPYDASILYEAPLVDLTKRTFLHIAAQKQDISLMEFLIRNGADAAVRSSDGLTSLEYYTHCANIAQKRGNPIDPVTHEEIIGLLTPKCS
jgi:hypothetical protein